MKETVLLHNPEAGDKEHSKEMLLELLEAHGYNCRYTSTQQDYWDEMDAGADLLIIAGGDGTVRKVVTELWQRNELLNIPPIGLLPLGTANNIASSLNIKGDFEEIVSGWEQGKPVKFDVGIVEGLHNTKIFLESFGVGLFPSFIKKADSEKIDENKSLDGRLEAGIKAFHKFISGYQPHKCILVADGEEYSGEFLMLEVMNINSIGPNLELAPAADIGDGQFDIVMISEKDKEELANYTLNKLKGEERPVSFSSKQAKRVRIKWEGSKAHADDQMLNLNPFTEIKIGIKPRLLTFLA